MQNVYEDDSCPTSLTGPSQGTETHNDPLSSIDNTDYTNQEETSSDIQLDQENPGNIKLGKSRILIDTSEKEDCKPKAGTGTMKHSGKSLVRWTVMKWSVIVDSSEEESKDIWYVELSHDDNAELSDKQMSDVREQSCAVGDNVRGGFDNLCFI